jgi:mRNA interferase RelE/StbE
MTESQKEVEYRIQLTPKALEMLAQVKDQRHRKSLSLRIDKLKLDPEKQGKPLVDQLKGYRSVRAVNQRYRIREHPTFVGAKHSGEESISQNREFIIRMLRPQWGIYKNGMLPRIIYKVDRDLILVLVVGVGLRREGDGKDIYAMMVD